MKNRSIPKCMAVILVFAMALSLLPLAALATGSTYTLDIADVADVPQNTKADGDTQKCGTDGYFTIFFSAKTRIESNTKDFTDGFSAGKRLNFGGSTKIEDPIVNAVQIKTGGAAQVKVWWVSGGDGREVAIYSESGAVLCQTAEGSVKNSLYIATLSVSEAGTYYIGNVGGNNNYYKLEVTEEASASEKPERAAWKTVAAPVIGDAVDTGDGEIAVTVSAVVGHDGGDEVVVTMLDSKGNEVLSRNSVMERDSHTIRFAPEASGEYTFRAVLKREGEADKKAKAGVKADFVLPLESPVLRSATSAGGGKITLVWTAVKEARHYEVLCDEALVGTATGTEYTVSGLTVGQKYRFRVIAVRGEDRNQSGPLDAIATDEAQVAWGFTTYGTSTSTEYNGYEGNLNEDGSVTVYSENGKGKIVPASTDGIAFYYTAIPTTHNFTLRAKVTVDSWTYSNGQEGFGLLVADRLGEHGDKSDFWNNQFMACATKIEYRYESGSVYTLDGPGTKYTMKLGLGSIAKTGLTKQNLPLVEKSDANALKQFFSEIRTLEWAAGEWEKESGTYNIVGNGTNESSQSVGNVSLTTFILEIQKNNTGYFITYYAEDGTVLCRNKYYGADALNQLDEDYVYAGFFAARNVRATFSDVAFTTILCSEDAPAEEKPKTEITPTVSISSGAVTTKADYQLLVDTNVDGKLQIMLNTTVLAEADVIEGEIRFRKTVSLPAYGEHRVKIRFSPDPDQELGEGTILSSARDIFAEITVLFNKGNYHRKVIYVAPEGLPNGNGSRDYPYDIQSAVNNVVPGQTIVLLEGTYKLETPLRIQRGMDGTEEKPICMIADPMAKSRPVLDFQQLCAGIIHGGNYWYFQGFDVTNSQNGQKGFQVSGSHNILDRIHTYRNGNTGVQISRLSGKDLYPDWPAHNLVLNCDSYFNMDSGFEDADGFAAKLTCGDGNVFDGCVAYHNADDGWDLYAKVETGPIGTVTIRNCVAYGNGYIEGYSDTGNGNGFKLGGEGIPGRHVLENSVAFYNLSKGIDSNSCPDVIVKNCTSYNNGSHNVALYTKKNANTDFVATGILSFKDSTNPVETKLVGEKLEGVGTQQFDAYMGSSNYYWNGSDSVSTDGSTIREDVFVSLQFKGVARRDDGTVDLQGFLQPNASAPAGAGAVEGNTPSKDAVIPQEDAQHSHSDTWFSEDQMYHWRECECGDRAFMGEHDLQWIVDKEATAQETGLKHQQCTVCGHKKPAVITYYEESATPSEPAPTVPDDTLQPDGAPIGAIVAIFCGVGLTALSLGMYLGRKKKNKEK